MTETNSDDGRVIEFYFDFASPFSYLAQARLPEMAERYGYSVQYRPIDVVEAKREAGNYGPSNREVPHKLAVLSADLRRWAKRYGVPLEFPPQYGCARWNIGCLMAIDRNQAREYLRAAYHRIWGCGADPGNDAQLGSLALELGWEPEEFLQFIDSPVALDRYRQLNKAAFRSGVFGVPLMRIDDESWWGNDRLFLMEEYIAAQLDVPLKHMEEVPSIERLLLSL